MSVRVPSLLTQFRLVFPFLLRIWIIGGSFLAMILVIAFLNEVPVRTMSRDPAALLDAPFYLGMVSNLGALVWAAAASICFFAYLVLCRQNLGTPANKFLLHSGMLTSLLLLDDFFMLHEEAFPLHLGFSELVVVGTYGVLVFLYLYTYRFTILKTDYLVLFAAFSLLGSSVLVDLIPEYFLGKYLVEDGFKFMGIITWMFYFGRTSLAAFSRQKAHVLAPQPVAPVREGEPVPKSAQMTR